MKPILGSLALVLMLLHPQQAGEGGAPKGPAVGKPAPAFRLNDHQAEVVSLGGKTSHWSVLAFFPKAATPG